MPEGAQRTYHIGFAIVQLSGLFTDELGSALHASWRPGATVNRYRRQWHLARIQGETPNVMMGRIGFVSENNVTTVSFDERQGDFVSDAVPSGVLVPFAIRLSDGVIAYQLRPGLVRENSFTGALEALLNSSGREYVWSVEPAGQTMTWEQWRVGIDRITAFNIRVDRPNPHYDDDYLIEDAVENIRVKYLSLAGVARDEDAQGIDPDADLFQQALDHVLRDYGRAAVQGENADGESTWTKLRGAFSSVVARKRVKLVGPPEVPDHELVSVLQDTGALEPTPQIPELDDAEQ